MDQDIDRMFIAQVGNDVYICTLCDTGKMNKGTLQHHLRASGHRWCICQEMKRNPPPGSQQVADGIFVCALCQTGRVDVHVLRSHLKGKRHKKNLALQDLANQLLSSSFVHTPWKSRLDTLLGNYVMTQSSEEYVEVENQINKFLQMERTSLLELAVWRASCLDFDGSGPFGTMQDIRDNSIVVEGHEPDVYKSERRFNGGVAVVIHGVLRFI